MNIDTSKKKLFDIVNIFYRHNVVFLPVRAPVFNSSSCNMRRLCERERERERVYISAFSGTPITVRRKAC